MARNPYVFQTPQIIAEEDFLSMLINELDTEFVAVKYIQVAKKKHTLYTATFMLAPSQPSGAPDTSGILVPKKYVGALVRITYTKEILSRSPRNYRYFPVWISCRCRSSFFKVPVFWRELNIDRIPYIRCGLENIAERITRKLKTEAAQA